jgi:hypothetical protein
MWPMPIDECRHTFLELTTTVLPAHMQRLREAMESPVEAAIFAQAKQGTSAIAKQLQLRGDFAGCYIFLEQTRPIYAGISRKVLSRIRQHLCGKTHFDASLAYRMAKRNMPTRLKRGEAMQDSAFRKVFAEGQAHLRELRVAFIPIENDLEIYLFEAFCAMELDTWEWNTFRTH